MNIRYLISRALLHARPRAIRGSIIHNDARVGAATQMVDSSIGRYSYCGTSCVIVCADIGNFCSIADGVLIGAASHAIDHVSTSPVFHAGRNPFRHVFSNIPAPSITQTKVGHDVWIGQSAKILSGVQIGNGSIIAMGAVVTKDVEPYTIVGGVPAKMLKRRLESTIANQIDALNWWEWDDSKIMRYAHLFDNPIEFLAIAR